MAQRRPAATRETYHHGHLREALLEAAEALLAEVGPVELSLREVARRAGVSHGAPAHHFPTKADLLRALAARGFSELTKSMQDAQAIASTRPEDQLLATGMGYAMFALKKPALFRVMFGREYCAAGPAELNDAGASAYTTLLAALAPLQRDKRPPFLGDDPLAEATYTWSVVHGLATLAIDGQLGPLAPDELLPFVRKVLGFTLR